MKRTAVKVVGYLVALGLLSFLLHLVLRQWPEVLISFRQSAPGELSGSMVLLIGSLLLSGIAWHLCLLATGARSELGQALPSYLLSTYARYLPGSVWGALGRVQFARSSGISTGAAMIAVTLEQVLALLGAVLMALLCVPFLGAGFIDEWGATMVLALGLCALLLLSKPFMPILNRLLARFGRGPLDITVSRSKVLFLLLFYLLIWLVSGVAFSCFVRSFQPLPWSDLPVLLAAYAIAFVAGYLAPFAPAGLGVREGIITLLLSPVMSPASAAAVALSSRLWLVGAELILLPGLLLLPQGRATIARLLKISAARKAPP